MSRTFFNYAFKTVDLPAVPHGGRIQDLLVGGMSAMK